MDDYRLIATEEDLQQDVVNEEEEDDDIEEDAEEDNEDEEGVVDISPLVRTPSGALIEDDDYEEEDDDDYEYEYDDEDEDEDEDEDDDYEDEDDESEDYEGEEVDEVIPSETMLPRVSSSIADGSVADSDVFNGKPVSQEKELSRGVIDVCPICFEACTSDGDHRFCCLPCGHVYGISCIKRWLQRCKSYGKCPQCPQCKSFCTLKDVIVLYATRLCVADEMAPEGWDWRSDMQKLQNQLSQLEDRIQAGRIEREEWQRQMMEEWQQRMKETRLMMEEQQQQMMEEMQRRMTESFKQSGNHPGSLPL